MTYILDMKRNAEAQLKKWMISKHRKPLIVRGARQVGKSYLIRQFVKNEQYKLIEINLEKVKFKTVENKNFSVKDWINEIEIISNQKINQKQYLN